GSWRTLSRRIARPTNVSPSWPAITMRRSTYARSRRTSTSTRRPRPRAWTWAEPWSRRWTNATKDIWSVS
ncbi:hypothetical protein AAVH_42539, partial [Aphelenchoides avenae]